MHTFKNDLILFIEQLIDYNILTSLKVEIKMQPVDLKQDQDKLTLSVLSTKLIESPSLKKTPLN